MKIGKPSVVEGSAIRYKWMISGKKVGTKASLKLKSAWKRKTVKALVTVVKQGYKTATKTYKLGKVKNRCPPGEHWTDGGGPFDLDPGCYKDMG